MNNNVNIISTNDFNEFISSLNEISNYISNVEQQLNDIKSSITYDPTGEIMAAYSLIDVYIKPDKGIEEQDLSAECVAEYKKIYEKYIKN